MIQLPSRGKKAEYLKNLTTFRRAYNLFDARLLK